MEGVRTIGMDAKTRRESEREREGEKSAGRREGGERRKEREKFVMKGAQDGGVWCRSVGHV